jgi:hypothetical protein
MDPNLFHLDYDKVFEALITVVFLSLFIERVLSILFEWRPFIYRTESGPVVAKLKGLKEGDSGYDKIIKQKKASGLKEIISLAVSILVCWYWDFDALTVIFVTSDHMQIWGYILTGFVVAGGSKGSIQLFKNWMGIMSSAEKDMKEFKKDQS